MSRDFLERDWVTIDIQRPYIGRILVLTKLLFEELGKIGRCSRNLVQARIHGLSPAQH